MNGAIKELEELFSTKAKGNTVYFNDVNYTPLPLPVQNAVKAIMEEYPDMKYRMGLYSVTVLEKGEAIKSSRRARKIQSRNTSDSITSSGAFADRDESENPECIIEIKKDGKWKPVGIDKNAESGWSTEVKFTVFESEDKARKSGMARRVQNEGYSEKDGTLRFSTK